MTILPRSAQGEDLLLAVINGHKVRPVIPCQLVRRPGQGKFALFLAVFSLEACHSLKHPGLDSHQAEGQPGGLPLLPLQPLPGTLPTQGDLPSLQVS